MSDSASPSPDSLVQADLLDMFTGNTLYIRGQRAICTKFDYPHVYWRFTPSDDLHAKLSHDLEWSSHGGQQHDQTLGKELHRSITSSPQLFQVLAKDKKHSLDQSRPHTRSESDEEESDSEPMHDDIQHSTTNEQQQTQQQQQNTNNNNNNDNNDVQSTRNTLVASFLHRPAKHIVQNISNQEEVIELSQSRSAVLESCEKSKFTFPSKINAVTITNCTDCEVHLAGVIATCELIRAVRVRVLCSGACPTYTLDSCQGCVVELSGSVGSMLVSDEHSAGNTAVARTHDGMQITQRLPTKEEEAVVESSPVPAPQSSDSSSDGAVSESPSSSHALVQYRTRWLPNKQKFTVGTLTRHGEIGYFDNEEEDDDNSDK